MQILIFGRKKLKQDLWVVVASHTQICLYFCKIYKQSIGFVVGTVSYKILWDFFYF